MSRVIDYDPLTGLTTTFDYIAAEDKTVLTYTQDCTRIIEDNKQAMLDEDMHKAGSKEEWAHYARIPIVVQYEWLQKFGVNFANPDHWPGVVKLINSPDYRYLKRTSYFHDR